MKSAYSDSLQENFYEFSNWLKHLNFNSKQFSTYKPNDKVDEVVQYFSINETFINHTVNVLFAICNARKFDSNEE